MRTQTKNMAAERCEKKDIDIYLRSTNLLTDKQQKRRIRSMKNASCMRKTLSFFLKILRNC